MSDFFVQITGWVSTVLLIVCNLPQVIKTYNRRKVDDISVTQWWVLFAGFALGLVYGIGIEEWPIICARVFNLVISGSFLVLYYKYKR